MPTVAELRLKELCSGILQTQSLPKTMAYFRLSNPAIVHDLEEFAASPNSENGRDSATAKPLLDQVLDLFQHLNRHMAEQEQSCPTWGDFFIASKSRDDKQSSSTPTDTSSSQPPSPTEISVVFGGKYSKNPASISEKLVSKLVLRSQTVYTVSRSTCQEHELPDNVKHIPKQNLDVSDGSSNDNSYTTAKGADEFYDVMAMAKEEWLKTSSEQQVGSSSATTMLVFYFTLGQHKGVNPFVRNLNSAQNFHRALQKLSLTASSPDLLRPASSESDTPNTTGCRSWRVVVTGTDATLPSTHPPSEMTMVTGGNDAADVAATAAAAAATVLTVPTYKIGTNNFVYAMSKLGQSFWIANAVARLLMVQNGDKDIHEYEEIGDESEDIFQKIRAHVIDAGEDGVYHGDSEECETSISMEDLDAMSLKMSSRLEEGIIRDHFRIAEQISICYTPLHAKPWTEDAIQSTVNDSEGSPSSLVSSSQKAFILEQVVKRLKNAISIESAASSHFL